MVLVDTSVLINFFKGSSGKPIQKLKNILHNKIPFGVTPIIMQELLQGARDEKEFKILQEYLETQNFFHPLNSINSFIESARIYFLCRKKGLTIRSSTDCLIAQIAIENDLFILHDDQDFVNISKVVNLKLY